MYLTYEEYTEMGGDIEESAYDDFEVEAEATINWYTFNRLKGQTEYPDEVKRLMKYLIGLAKIKSDAINASGSGDGSTTTAGIASQSNDGVSISYNIISSSDLIEIARSEVENAVKRYLQGVTNELGQKVLYRGLYPNE